MAQKLLASTFDRAILAFDEPERTCDFCNVLTLEVGLSHGELTERLSRGFARALELFPRAAHVLRAGKWWTPPDEPRRAIEQRSGSEDALFEVVAAYAAPPLDTRRTMFEQLLYHVEGTTRFHLLTRGHRALTDGVGLFQLLEVQLTHAFGRELDPSTYVDSVELLDHAAPVRRSKYAYDDPPSALCERAEIGGEKRFRLISVPAAPVRALVAQHPEEFTYNDFFLAVIFDALDRWSVRPREDWRPAIRLPMNVRRTWHRGFGNGSTGVTVYASWKPDSTFIERCTSVREQVRWGRENGAWFRGTGTSPLLMNVPFGLFRYFLRRAGRTRAARLSAGTLFFSHVERQSKHRWEVILPEVRRVFFVGPLMTAQPIMIIALTHQDVTNVCIAYNERPFGAAAIEELAGHIEGVIAEATRGAAVTSSSTSPEAHAAEAVGAIEVQSI